MTEDILYQKLVDIFSSKYVSRDPSILNTYSKDLSFYPEKAPKYVAWPTDTKKIEEVLKLANELKFSIVPISSSPGPRHHGDTIPHKGNAVVLDLSNMKKILNIDGKNRVVMIEPGVTFGELIPELQSKGLRLLLPLNPRSSKSVLTSALEREPITIPRYHWDISDPLLCTEVIFGTGDLFRTGTAVGPGTIKQQQESGAAQVNPMGPTHFSPYRVIQGAQGSIGVVTWATLKLEFLPTIQKVFHLQSDNLQELMDIQYELLKYRLADEVLILNNLNLACLVKQNSQVIENLSQSLKNWNLIYILAGRGKLANDKIAYQEEDINDIIGKLNLSHLKQESKITGREILDILGNYTNNPWRMRLKGAFQDIFFITNFENIPKFTSLVDQMAIEKLGIYIQPLNQGTSYYCEFDLYYDSKDEIVIPEIKQNFMDISSKLMEAGAFFNRPYSLWAKEAFANHSPETITALKKVKKIFDPNNVLNPGVLCFDN